MLFEGCELFIFTTYVDRPEGVLRYILGPSIQSNRLAIRLSSLLVTFNANDRGGHKSSHTLQSQAGMYPRETRDYQERERD